MATFKSLVAGALLLPMSFRLGMAQTIKADDQIIRKHPRSIVVSDNASNDN